MKYFISTIFLCLTLLFSSNSFGQSLEFLLVPPKSEQAGKAVNLILPVRVLDNKCQYKISTTGQPNYPVEAPETLSPSEGSSEVVYLPFRVQIPSSAPSGQIYQLDILFTPNENCSDTQEYKHSMAIKIQSYNNVSIEGPRERITQTSQVGNLDVLLRNSGNTNLDLDVLVQNLTPNVRVSLNQTKVSIAPGSYKNIKVNIDFSASGADFAAFKVIARSNGQRFLSKSYQVRLLKGPQSSGDQRTLQSQFYLTNEFFSEGNQSQNYQNIGASISGDLSDFYAFSLFAQSNYLQSENETNHYELDLTKYDDFKVTLGSNLNPLNTSIPGIKQLKGIRGEKTFLKNLRVGMYQGEDFEGNNHVGTYVDLNQSYKNRWIVFWDRNTTTGFDSAGLSGEKYIRINQALAIAPSLIVAQDELRGDYSRVGMSLSSFIANKAPLQMEIAREEDVNYFLESMNGSISIPFRKTNIEFGFDVDDLKAKNSNYLNNEGLYSESYFRVLFPILKNLNGQATVRYQKTIEGDSGVAPELFISGSKGQLNGWLRIGKQLTQNAQEIIETNIVEGLGAENYAQLNIQYLPFGKYGIYIGAETYRSQESSDYRDEFSLGLQRTVHNEDSYMRLGLRSARNKNFLQEQKTDSVDMQYHWQIDNNWSLRFAASVDHLKEIDEYDYQASIGIQWTPQIPVSRKVENLFGGRSTGQLSGQVCIDYNENHICDGNDKLLSNVEVRLGGLISTTDEKGFYQFKNIAPAEYTLLVIKSTLPAEGRLINNDRRLIIKSNDQKKNDFLLRWNGQVKVIVYEDVNEDGKWQSESEKQLPNVEVQLVGNEIDLKKTTYSNRPLVFNNLSRGEYRVSISKLLQNSRAANQDGIKLIVPNPEGNWAYLGLSFTGGQQEDTEVVATLESNIIFEDDLMANVYIDDPELEVKSFKYSCEGFESSSIPNDNEDSSYILNLDLSSCEVNPNTSTIGLKLTLFDSNTQKLILYVYEIIIE